FRSGFNALGAKLVGGPMDGLGTYLMHVQNQMALVAGAVMGIMLIPFVSSLSDDILNAVPQSLRDGSLAMGATKSATAKRVVRPAGDRPGAQLPGHPARPHRAAGLHDLHRLPDDRAGLRGPGQGG